MCVISVLDIKIAGINFSIGSENPISLSMQEQCYQPFVQGPDAGSIIIPVNLEFKKFSDFNGLCKVLNGGAWDMYADGEGFVMTSTAIESDGPAWHMRFDRQCSYVSVYPGRDAAGGFAANPFSYPLDQLLLMYVLAYREGALVHSAAVNLREKAYMFSGRSGAGKSTLSRQFRSLGYEVLSDDRVAVRKMENGFHAFGTPWSGEADIALNKGLPLGGIFFISHGAGNELRRISPAEAAERLMPVTSIPFYDKETTLNILSFCEAMVMNVPAYELHFRPDNEVVDFLEKFISE